MKSKDKLEIDMHLHRSNEIYISWYGVENQDYKKYVGNHIKDIKQNLTIW